MTVILDVDLARPWAQFRKKISNVCLTDCYHHPILRFAEEERTNGEFSALPLRKRKRKWNAGDDDVKRCVSKPVFLIFHWS